MPLNVLVADDNAVNRTVTMTMLERLGYKASAAADGQEAIDCVRQQAFDLVLMDVLMPRIDGLAATRQIRQDESLRSTRAFIVAMTANVSVEDRNACREADMDGFLSKPVRMSELRGILEQAHRRFHTQN
jgi:CheY-like chemotaxis protein